MKSVSHWNFAVAPWRTQYCQCSKWVEMSFWGRPLESRLPACILLQVKGGNRTGTPKLFDEIHLGKRIAMKL